MYALRVLGTLVALCVVAALSGCAPARVDTEIGQIADEFKIAISSDIACEGDYGGTDPFSTVAPHHAVVLAGAGQDQDAIQSLEDLGFSVDPNQSTLMYTSLYTSGREIRAEVTSIDSDHAPNIGLEECKVPTDGVTEVTFS